MRIWMQVFLHAFKQNVHVFTPSGRLGQHLSPISDKDVGEFLLLLQPKTGTSENMHNNAIELEKMLRDRLKENVAIITRP